MDEQLLGGLTAAAFFADYWQKKPLLVRGAIKNFVSPISRDELAGLALEPSCRSRLVQEKGGKKPWQLRHGPFTAEVLTKLAPSHWTLLVANVEEWSEAAALLLDRFNFVPNWRADDLMISVAPVAGSVGPHVDSYDVFLLQGEGQRTWSIQTKPDLTWRQGLDLRILKHYHPEQSWTLDPGDMLYLPPGVAHHGVAVTPCMTYSIGYRAPAQSDLIADLFNLPPPLSPLVVSEELYADPDRQEAASAGEVTAADVARAQRLLRPVLDNPEVLGRWFAAFVTKTAAPVRAQARRPSVARLTALLQSDIYLWRSDSQRLAFFQAPGGALFLYVQGEEWCVDSALRPLLERLCQQRRWRGRELAKSLPKGKKAALGIELLRRLWQATALYAAK